MHDIQPCFLNYPHNWIICILQRDNEPDIADTPVALLTVVSDNATGAVHFNPESISVVVEDEVVLRDLPRLTDALVLLFGLIYALHLDYPKKHIHLCSENSDVS